MSIIPSSTIHLEQTPGSSVLIPRKEICRYLGYRRIEPTSEIMERIESCAGKLNAQSAPKAAWQVFPLELSIAPEEKDASILHAGEGTSEAGDDVEPYQGAASMTEGAAVSGQETSVLRAAGLEIHSRGLARNCRDCSAVVMLAVTIGSGCDFLIRRAEAVSMTDAAIYQAAGAAMVEEWCDTVNEKIRRELLEQYGFHARPRFSPGYGDLPLELQKDFFRILNLPRNCGMSLGDTLLMSPSKSVTAFIGLKPGEDADCVPAGCEVCGKSSDCSYRR